MSERSKVVRAIIYCRISRDRGGDALGVARQESECRDLCERSGWLVTDVLTDNDISAYSGKKRPAYTTLLERVDAGAVDVVVAWNTDRLHRRLSELVEYTEVCARRTVTTHTVRTGPIDLSTPSGILVAQQLGAVAEYESRNRSARVRAAKDQRAAAGTPSGGPRPFGWDADGVTERPEEVALIRDATSRVLRGESLYSITREWRAKDVRTVYGNQMYVGALRSILLRPRNAGLRSHRGVVVGTATWDPVIDPEEWHACRRLITDPSRKLSWSTKPKYFGAMRYLCGARIPDDSDPSGWSTCEFPMKVNGTQVTKVYKHAQGKKYRYRNYVCTRDPKLGVKHVTARQERVDEYVTRSLIAGMLEQGVEPVTETTAPVETSSDIEDEVEAAQAALASELAAGRLSATAFSAANTQLAERLQKMQAESADASLSRITEAQLSGFHTDPEGTFNGLPLEVKRELLERYVTVTILPAPHPQCEIRERVQLDWHFDNDMET